MNDPSFPHYFPLSFPWLCLRKRVWNFVSFQLDFIWIQLWAATGHISSKRKREKTSFLCYSRQVERIRWNIAYSGTFTALSKQITSEISVKVFWCIKFTIPSVVSSKHWSCTVFVSHRTIWALVSFQQGGAQLTLRDRVVVITKTMHCSNSIFPRMTRLLLSLGIRFTNLHAWTTKSTLIELKFLKRRSSWFKTGQCILKKNMLPLT